MWLDADEDGFQCLPQRENSTTAHWTNAHNQKFAAGFQALCPDSDRNKVNSRLPGTHCLLLDASSSTSLSTSLSTTTSMTTFISPHIPIVIKSTVGFREPTVGFWMLPSPVGDGEIILYSGLRLSGQIIDGVDMSI